MPEDSRKPRRRETETVDVVDQTRAASSAKLARDERAAALRALAGRLAHQLRNPLAAVRAACSGLRSEVEDDEHRETLDLTLQEIDRMLGFVSATVQSIPARRETPQATDPALEIIDVVDIMHSTENGANQIAVGDVEHRRCLIPRDGLRVAVYSICEHFLSIAEVNGLVIDNGCDAGRLTVRFRVDLGPAGEDVGTAGLSSNGIWVQPIGLLVAERFAREAGGRMLRNDSGGDDQLTLTLELPLHDV
ncbi:MAG: hypothetical protein KDI82_00605 [Gammaproteobacteria bacterium]|nr:hypothetical protein [Gammaproteobacteria bacterium]